MFLAAFTIFTRISIHAPRAGRDFFFFTHFLFLLAFQSTRPVRGATNGDGKPNANGCISIHAPRAGRDAPVIMINVLDPTFQSTRPVRGATRQFSMSRQAFIFQSTRPVRGATRTFGVTSRLFSISIHAPRAGRDREAWRHQLDALHFNPRAPCGARP